jgi:hypothetical protein
MPSDGKPRVNLNRGFDNIGSNRSQAARIQVVPCGLRKDDVVKAKKDAQSVVKAIKIPQSQATTPLRQGSNTKPPFSNLVVTYSTLVSGEVSKAEGLQVSNIN